MPRISVRRSCRIAFSWRFLVEQNKCRSGCWTGRARRGEYRRQTHQSWTDNCFHPAPSPFQLCQSALFDTNKPQTGPFPPGGALNGLKSLTVKVVFFFFFPSSWFCRLPLIICLGDDDKQPWWVTAGSRRVLRAEDYKRNPESKEKRN